VKILWVKPGKLLPLDTGGKLRTYNILRHLNAAHDVAYLTYYEGARDQKYEEEISQHLPGAVPVCSVGHAARGLARYFDYARNLPSRVPYSVRRYSFPEVQRILAEWISGSSFDVVVCDFLCSTINFPESLETPTVLFQHNVETVLWERRARFEVRCLDRLVARIESLKVAAYESARVRRFHHVLAVSERDRRAMGWMVDPAHISVVPTGVDLSQYQYDPECQAAAPLVMFTGSMDWAPNVDGVEYFCKEIWPRVLAAFPEARFRIVGRDPHARVRSLACESVEVTGTVPSIVDHLRQAAVMVVPLRIGGGTRIKIYEGMAMGKATVSTSVGAEGLDVHHERDILLADEPERFAEYVVLLLRDRKMRREYEASAAATARQYDWSVIAGRFVDVLARFARPVESSPFDREGALLSAAQR
jgi:polysaccharide biosynthesis protein PslH